MTKGRAVSDDYFKLVRAFPLRPIRNQREYDEAGKVLGTTHAMASLMLHGKRGISAESARTLADYFKVNAGLFV